MKSSGGRLTTAFIIESRGHFSRFHLPLLLENGLPAGISSPASVMLIPFILSLSAPELSRLIYVDEPEVPLSQWMQNWTSILILVHIPGTRWCCLFKIDLLNPHYPQNWSDAPLCWFKEQSCWKVTRSAEWNHLGWIRISIRRGSES